MDARTRPAPNVFVREGEYWTVVFDGRVSRVRDAKGLHYLDHLLRHPGEEFHAMALVSAVDAPPPARLAQGLRASGLEVGGRGDAGPVLDASAVAAYRQRFRELQEDLGVAEEEADGERSARARVELDALAEQLASAVGLGERHRRAGSPTERARLAVTKAIRSALRKLDQADPALGRHLDRTVRTGTFCAYLPDPKAGIVWASQPIVGDEANAASPTTPVLVRRSPRTGYVGRAFERRLATELVAAAAAGRGGVLLVSGEAGIGKTRLVEEALAEADARGMRTFIGRCVEAERAVPWLPFVEVLEQVAHQLADDELGELLAGSGPEVAKVLPALRRRFPDLPPPLELPAEQARRFLYATLCDLVLRLGTARPVVLVLEDLHWADSSTLRMLEHLADRLQAARVLAAATFRSDEAALGSPLAHTVERLARHPACTALALDRLDRDEVGELAAAVTGRVLSDDVITSLCHETDGNPLFVVELVKHRLSSEGMRSGDAAVGPRPAPGPGDVPETLRLVLGHRLGRLSPECRAVVDAAAVAGRAVDVGLLVAMEVADETGVAEAIDEAEASGVLVASPTAEGERLTFTHALVRQVALAELSAVRRSRLHARAAEALMCRHRDEPWHAAAIADHLARGGSAADLASTLEYLERAARRSLESEAPDDAAARFGSALARVPARDRLTRARLLAGLGHAQRAMKRHDEANAAWREALDELERGGGGDPTIAADVCRELGRSLDATGGLDEAVEVIRRGLRITGSTPTRERSRLQAALGYVLALRGDHDEAEESLDEAVAIAAALGDDRLRGEALLSRTLLHYTAGDLIGTCDSAGTASRLLLAAGQVWDATQAQVTTLFPRLWLGRPNEARRLASEALPVAERVGHVAAAFLAGRTQALADVVESGAIGPFLAEAEDAVALSTANRLRWLADARVFAGTARFWRGDWDEAGVHLQAASSLPSPPVYAGRYDATRLVLLAWQGDGQAFDELAGRLRSRLACLGLPQSLGSMAVTLAEVEGYALLGRQAAGAARYPDVRALLEAGVVMRPPDLRLLPTLAGLTAGLAGDWTAADGHFAEARRLVDALPHPREAPDVDFLEAVVLLQAARPGHEGRAERLLARAAARYRELGMPRHRARAEAFGVRP